MRAAREPPFNRKAGRIALEKKGFDEILKLERGSAHVTQLLVRVRFAAADEEEDTAADEEEDAAADEEEDEEEDEEDEEDGDRDCWRDLFLV